jgi:hypothetical protein
MVYQNIAHIFSVTTLCGHCVYEFAASVDVEGLLGALTLARYHFSFLFPRVVDGSLQAPHSFS